MTLRVLVADDSSYARDGLRSILAHDRRVEVIGEASNGCQAVELTLSLNPDVVLMDLQMPLMDGIEATRVILHHRPRQRIIGLAVHPHSAEAALSAGASACLLKDAPREELLAAICAPALTT